jgi:hypothetical protein
MPSPDQDLAKPKSAEPKTGENSNLKPGSPPRPATEPSNTGASNSGKTLTDPATGKPNP